MVLTAAGHTTALLFSRADPGNQRALKAMRRDKLPLGMGMNPSLEDIYWSMSFTVGLTFAALGGLNLVVAATSSSSAALLRRLSWVNLLWVSGFIALNAVYRVPPPLIFGTIIEIFVVAWLSCPRKA